MGSGIATKGRQAVQSLTMAFLAAGSVQPIAPYGKFTVSTRMRNKGSTSSGTRYDL